MSPQDFSTIFLLTKIASMQDFLDLNSYCSSFKGIVILILLAVIFVLNFKALFIVAAYFFISFFEHKVAVLFRNSSSSLWKLSMSFIKIVICWVRCPLQMSNFFGILSGPGLLLFFNCLSALSQTFLSLRICYLWCIRYNWAFFFSVELHKVFFPGCSIYMDSLCKFAHFSFLILLRVHIRKTFPNRRSAIFTVCINKYGILSARELLEIFLIKKNKICILLKIEA